MDYDSARHHLEALQSAKKKDEAKITKVAIEKWWEELQNEPVFKHICLSFTPQAEEEFTRAQNVFEEINNELREELPVLYQRYERDPDKPECHAELSGCDKMKV